MNKPIKKITLITSAGALALSAMFSGCSALENFTSKKPELPANAQSIEMYESDSSSMMFIDFGGRTYAPFGETNGTMYNSELRDCVGYIDDDKNDRVYTLNGDPFDNYLVTLYANRIMDQPMFWRDCSTYNQDIFTPEYIASAKEEEWGHSGCYYEMKEFTVDVALEADDIYELSMQYNVNGEECGTGGVRNTDKTELKKGEELSLSIAEIAIYGKFDRDEPFDAECHFFVETMAGDNYELEYVYNDTVSFGDKISLTLTGNAQDGYKIG